MNITSVLFGVAILGCIILAAYFVRRDRGTHADEKMTEQAKAFLFAGLFFLASGIASGVADIASTPAKFRTSAFARMNPDWQYGEYIGHKDQTWVNKWGLQRMEQAATRKNTLITQAFLADLNMKQTKNAIKAVVPFDYEAYAQAQYLSTYDGEYRFAVRGGDSFRVIVSGGNVTRKNNGNPVATITAESPNGFYLVLPEEEILLTQSGIRWQGNNLAGRVVTLKKL